VKSGFTSIIQAQEDQDHSRPPAVDDTVVHHVRDFVTYRKGDHSTFLQFRAALFVAGLVDCSSASIYLHKSGDGLLISSNYESVQY
jgi:hypothetical protein